MSRATVIILPHGGIVLEEVEKDFIRQAMERTGGNQSAAARLLGISRYALRYRMEKFKISFKTATFRNNLGTETEVWSMAPTPGLEGHGRGTMIYTPGLEMSLSDLQKVTNRSDAPKVDPYDNDDH